MSVTEQLYRLQEIDLQVESNEQALRQKTSQLGESQVVIATREKLASEQQCRDELGQQQRSFEFDIEDLTNKITTIEEKLYGGKINNPKELANLQQEVNAFKASRDQLETRALEVMGQIETAEANFAETGRELNKLEKEWKAAQKILCFWIQASQRVWKNARRLSQLGYGRG